MLIVMMDPNSPASGFLAPLRRSLKRRFLDFVMWVVDRFSANPTRKWVRTPGLELVLDLDGNTFCGVGFGRSYEAFSFLGPCAEYSEMNCLCVDPDGNSLGESEKSCNLSYNADGFDIGTNSQWIVDHFSIQIDPFPEEPQFIKRVPNRAYTGKIVLNAQTLDHAIFKNVDSLTRYFGAPDQDHESPAHGTTIEGEAVEQPYSRMLMYERPNATWMFYIGETENVWTMYISPPIPNRRACCDGPECNDHGR